MDAQDVKTITRTAGVLLHIKENHVGYLLGLLVLHTTGILNLIQENAGGCFP